MMKIAATRGRVGRVFSSSPTGSSVHNPLPESGALSRSHGGQHARPTRTTIPHARRTRTGISAIALVAILALVTPADAQSELEVVGTWGGEVRAVCADPADPDVIYLGSGRNLVVLDVADPAEIIELGRIDLGNRILDLKVRNGYAFVGTRFAPNYFCTVDVSDPADLRVAWRSGDHTGAPWQVELHGDLAWVRWGTDLRRFNVSDPENPEWGGIAVGSIAETFTIAGDRMYVGVNDSSAWPRLHIYELTSDPVPPTLIGSGELEWAPHGFKPTAIRVVGDYAYMTLEEGFLAVWNVSDPNAPTHVGDYGDFDADTFGGLAVSDGIAYVADGALQMLDVATDPASPTWIAEFHTHGGAGSVEIVGSRAYVMSPGEGLIILDVSEPATPARLGDWYCPAVLRAMDKVGDTLYVVDAVNGISILDVSEPSAPALLGSYQTADTSEEWEGNRKITVRDGIAYLAAGRGGLEVVDVRDPTHTARLDSYVSEWDLLTHGVRLDGNLLYVGTARTWGGYFYIFDVSDPESLTLVSDDLHLTGGGPEEMDIDENGLVHAVSGSGVCVLNVDDPAHPFKWDCSYDPSQPSDVVVAGHLRYVTKENWYGDGGLYIQDIRDPLDPVNIGFFHANDARSLAFRNGMVYMIAHWEGGRGLLVLDVSDPANPFLIGHAPLPAGDEVLVDGRYAYVVDDHSLGLAVIDLTGMVARGDVNCDGAIDFDDIDPLVLALSGEETYRETLTDCHWLRADCNGDGEVNFDDIDAFVALLATP